MYHPYKNGTYINVIKDKCMHFLSKRIVIKKNWEHKWLFINVDCR